MLATVRGHDALATVWKARSARSVMQQQGACASTHGCCEARLSMARRWVSLAALFLAWAVVWAPEAEAAGSGLLGLARCHLCEVRLSQRGSASQVYPASVQPGTWFATSVACWLAVLRILPQTRAPKGPIEDCCQECDAATVDEATNDFFLPLLNDLSMT